MSGDSKTYTTKTQAQAKRQVIYYFFSNFIEAFFISLGQRALNCGFCVEERGVGGGGEWDLSGVNESPLESQMIVESSGFYKWKHVYSYVVKFDPRNSGIGAAIGTHAYDTILLHYVCEVGAVG